MGQNWLPDYLDVLPKLRFLDPLGAFLTGNAEPEAVEYSFQDVVKLSGHSCPTIAGAYGIVVEAMAALYDEQETPVRGQIQVECPETATSGAMGPLSQAITYLTGACAENGFYGLAGQFQRSGLLSFNQKTRDESPFIFTRTDTGKSVGVFYHAHKIPGDPKMGELMQKSLGGAATPEELKEFGRLWQERVRYVLEKAENRKELFEVVSL